MQRLYQLHAWLFTSPTETSQTIYLRLYYLSTPVKFKLISVKTIIQNYRLFSITYGYITKYNGKRLGFRKSQIADAVVIASEGDMVNTPHHYLIERKLKKRHPAQYISPPIQGKAIIKRAWSEQRYGFRRWDQVSVEGRLGYISALRVSGSFSIDSIDGVKIFPGDWVVGDDDGVVVIPQKKFAEIANRAMGVLELENRLRKEIDAGSTLARVVELLKWEKKG